MSVPNSWWSRNGFVVANSVAAVAMYWFINYRSKKETKRFMSEVQEEVNRRLLEMNQES